jgi:aspartyl-tRNA(Asn)/glutamyl-tRNA(Gln) amidotransferase subunit A
MRAMVERDVLKLPLHEAARLIERREVSPVELTELSLAESERTNPTSNAFRTLLPARAMEAARRAETEIAAGTYRGPLHGLPIAVKDLMDVRGETTPAGSKILANAVAREDSEAVQLLDEAGAVITGKTSMSELAYYPASANAHYGPVPNPWNPAHDSAGSSSGSGSAVARGLVYGATGSDTGGSIRMPAAVCGIVGLKPTFGRVSARGAVTLSWSLDHIGPMTRTVRDAALMLEVLAGNDPGDPRTRHVPADSYSVTLEHGVSGLRIGVLTDDGAGQLGTPAVLEGMRLGVAVLANAGAEIDEVAVPEFDQLVQIYGAIIAIEAAAYHERNLRQRPDDFGEIARDRLLQAYAYSPTTLARASQARAELRRRVDERLRGFDLLALPGMPHEAPPLGIVQSNTRFTGPFNALGWPAIVVPTILGEHNLPVSLQLAARPWLETLVLRAARVVEHDGPWSGRMPEE